jgi:hypothetical protein
MVNGTSTGFTNPTSETGVFNLLKMSYWYSVSQRHQTSSAASTMTVSQFHDHLLPADDAETHHLDPDFINGSSDALFNGFAHT